MDFSSFHIHILYAVEGLQLREDPYDSVAPKEMRPIIKKLLLAVLNAASPESAVKALGKVLNDLYQKEYVSARDFKLIQAIEKYKPDWMELIERLRTAHEPICHYFCSRAGLMLQRIDSEIMREILLRLASQDIPCLPVHDSAIVAAQYESHLRTAMDWSYRSIMGDQFYCPVDKK